MESSEYAQGLSFLCVKSVRNVEISSLNHVAHFQKQTNS